ncbi:hypothetical protein [Pelagibacterium limicola]|uniref:hypothetical protein n=1 Tax=Pelagibacterium limicola TaxID=2791022 RepID=UPI0018AF81F3|nr:hypothetical protein [Pelagibacterium limicola]
MLIWLLAGLASGFAASFVFAGASVWRYLAAGVAGAVIVSYLIMTAGVHVPVSDWLLRNLMIATLGALPVIIIARVFD